MLSSRENEWRPHSNLDNNIKLAVATSTDETQTYKQNWPMQTLIDFQWNLFTVAVSRIDCYRKHAIQSIRIQTEHTGAHFGLASIVSE